MAEEIEKQSGSPHKRSLDWYPLLVRVVIVLVVGAVLVIASILDDLFPIPGPLVGVTELTTTDGKDHLYIKRRVYGIAGSNDATVISMSSSRDFMPDSTREYVFRQHSNLLYRFRNDTLTIYPAEDSVTTPPKFHSSITVLQEIVPGLRYVSISDSVGLGGIAEVRYPRRDK